MATMSRKHYQKVADILAGELAYYPSAPVHHTVRRIALSLADMFKQDNARFDRAKFYAACGLTEDGNLS